MSTPEEHVRQALGLEDDEITRQIKEAGKGPSLGQQILAGMEQISKFGTGPTSLSDLAEAPATLAGLVEGAVVHPAASVAELVGADNLAEKWRSDNRGAGGYLRNVSRRMGATEEDIARSEMVGEFIGFTVPLLGSIKAAGVLTKLGNISGRLPRTANFIRDAVGGAIYGFTFTEGEDYKTRLHNAKHEAAVFAGFSLLATAGVATIRGLRNSRMYHKSLVDEVYRDLGFLRTGRDVETGLDHIKLVDAETARKMAELGNEEFYISTSAAGRRLLQQNAEIEAIVAGVKDHAGSEGSRFIVRGIKTPVPELVARVNKVFPGLKIQRVKMADGTYNLIIGEKTLTGNGLRQVKLTSEAGNPLFPGQQVTYNSSDGYVFVKSLKDNPSLIGMDDYVIIRDQQGLTKSVKLKNVKGKDYGIGEDLDEAVAELIRQHPEIASTYLDRTDSLYQEFAQWWKDKINQAVKTRQSTVSKDDFVEGVMKGEILYDMETERFVFSSADVAWRSETLTRLTPADLPVEQVVKANVDHISVMVPDELGTFEDMARQFLNEKGIKGKLDENVFQVWAAQKLRRELIGTVPPEELNRLSRLKTEYVNTVEAAERSVEDLGALSGYRVSSTADGRYFGRHVSTGQVVEFTDKPTAEAFFRNKLVEEGTDFAASGKVPFNPGTPGTTDHLPFREDIIDVPGLVDLQRVENLIPSTKINSVRDFFLKIENKSKGILRVFSEGYDLIDNGFQKMRAQFAPELQSFYRSWAHIGWRRRNVVGNWLSLGFKEGAVTDADFLRYAERFGLSNREKAAGINYLRSFDKGFGEIGVSGREMLRTWYQHVQPQLSQGLTVKDIVAELPHVIEDGQRRRLFSSFLKYITTGEMAQAELDPLLVQVKWFRSLRFEQHVYPHWERMNNMARSATLGLTEEQATAVARELGQPGGRFAFLPQDRRLPEMLDAVFGGSEGRKLFTETTTEFLNNLRGYPGEQSQALRRLSKKIFTRAGITADDRVLEDLIHTYMSLQYGAAMGLRPMLVTRNLTQNFWTSYLRLGGKHSGYAMEKAMTMEGFKEASAAGAIRSTSKGVMAGDVAFENMMLNAPWVTGSGMISQIGAGVTRAALRGGRIGRKVAEKFLIPYTNADDVNRVIAYHWQKKHTLEALRKYGGRANVVREGNAQTAFLEEGLPFFDAPIQRQFMRRLERLGEENALQWIGKIASDEANFVYGAASQPLWMQRPFGRLAGMFGTWPIWYRQYMARLMFNGTWKQRMGALVRSGIVAGAVYNTGEELGVDIWSWMAPKTPISYFGGPAVDILFDVRNVAQADLGAKPAAAGRLGKRLIGLSFPGQVLFRDLSLAGDQATDLAEAAFYIGIGRPELTPITMKDFMFDPKIMNDTTPIPGRTEDNLLRLPPLSDLVQ